MKDLRVKEIIDLVVSDVPDAEDKIKQMFDWYFDRVKTTSQWILGAAASLLVSVIVAFSEGKLNTHTASLWKPAVAISLSMATGTYGVYRLLQLRSIQQQFVASLKLLSDFRKIRLFLAKFRGSE